MFDRSFTGKSPAATYEVTPCLRSSGLSCRGGIMPDA